MARAWHLIHICALVFTGAWIVGHYSGDAGTDFGRPKLLTLRIAPNVILTAPPLTAQELRLRALRIPRRTVIVTVTRP